MTHGQFKLLVGIAAGTTAGLMVRWMFIDELSLAWSTLNTALGG